MNQACFKYDIDYSGMYLLPKRQQPSISDCQTACQLEPACYIFEYVTTDQNCYLKPFSTIAPATNYANMISGPPTCSFYQGKSIFCLFLYEMLG